MHVCAGIKINSPTACMNINHNIRHREKHSSKIMRQSFARCALSIARKTAIEVFPIEWRKPGAGLGTRHGKRGDKDNPSLHMLGLKLSKQAHHRNLTGIFIAMISCKDKCSGAGAIVDHSNGNHQVCPACKVIRVRDVKVAKLPTLK